MTLEEIAARESCTKQSIHQRLEAIHIRLRKILLAHQEEVKNFYQA
jgi:hypothetical protein